VDTSFVYLLPFAQGKTVQALEQTNVNEVYFNQERPKGWKSYLFRGDGLDSVFAVRKGIVIDVINNFEYDTAASYTSKTNVVIVEHPDGSIASYKGFKKNGIVVKEGDEILPHAFLGTIGSDALGHKKYLSLMVYYFTISDLDEKIAKTTAVTGIRFTTETGPKTTKTIFTTPRFLTEAGTAALVNAQKYITAISKEVMTKEMTRKEKKEFEKTASGK
jgi:hypothetical protein